MDGMVIESRRQRSRRRVLVLPQNEDSGAKAEGDPERGAEDAALLAVLDPELLRLRRLEPRRRLELRRRRLGGGGGGGGVRLRPDDESSRPRAGRRKGTGGRAAGQEERRAGERERRRRGGRRSHGTERSRGGAAPCVQWLVVWYGARQESRKGLVWMGGCSTTTTTTTTPVTAMAGDVARACIAPGNEELHALDWVGLGAGGEAGMRATRCRWRGGEAILGVRM